jgi:hypothetical protein
MSPWIWFVAPGETGVTFRNIRTDRHILDNTPCADSAEMLSRTNLSIWFRYIAKSHGGTASHADHHKINEISQDGTSASMVQDKHLMSRANEQPLIVAEIVQSLT